MGMHEIMMFEYVHVAGLVDSCVGVDWCVMQLTHHDQAH